MATTNATTRYLFPYPTGEDSLSNVALRIQQLAQRIDDTYYTMGIDTSFTNLMQNGDTAGGDLAGTYPNPIINNDKITTAMLKDNIITTNKLVDNNITGQKIQSSVNLSGDPTTTTQSTSDVSNKIATTSFVNAIANSIVSGSFTFPLNYIEFNTSSTSSLTYGRLIWDDTEGVVMMGIKGTSVPLYLGEQIMDRVTNVQGSTIGKLKVVRVRNTIEGGGSIGNRMAVKLAQADSNANASNTFGITTASIGDNQQGYTISQGLIKDVDTFGLTEGAPVYLSPTTAGELTSSKPQAPNHLVLVGFCVRQATTSTSNNGILLVKINDGFELDELHDVQIVSPATNHIISYDGTNSVWKNALNQGQIICTSGTRPVTGITNGTMIYETDTNRYMSYNGSTWLGISDTDIWSFSDTVFQGLSSTTVSPVINLINTTADTNAAAIALYKRRGAGTVTSGDTIGNIHWYANNGTTDSILARIRAASEGTVSATSTAGRIEFSTVLDGTLTLVERMRIANDGTIYVGNGATNATPNNATISATGGSGTNITGATLTISAGAGTGTGNSGPIVFQTVGGGSSGSALNALVERMRIIATGTIIFGNGVTSATPNSATISGTGGSGTNITGGSLTIAAGAGTGTGTSGDIIFQTVGAGSSGSTLNTLVERMRILSSNNIYFGNGTTNATPINANLSATGGSGTNVAGANMLIYGGASTGTANGGAIAFYTTSPSGVSGSTANSNTQRLSIDTNGFTSIVSGSFGRGAPVTTAVNLTVATTTTWIICTAAVVLTLPPAPSWTGREITVKNTAAATVTSASSNVVPLAGGAAGTAILAATAGKFATLVSDGANWIIMSAN